MFSFQDYRDIVELITANPSSIAGTLKALMFYMEQIQSIHPVNR